MHPQHGYYVSRDPTRARGGFQPPRRKSARCSANCWGCGRPRCGRRSASRRRCGWSNSDPARGTMMADALARAAGAAPRFIRRSPSTWWKSIRCCAKSKRATLTGVRNIHLARQHRRPCSAVPAVIFANEYFDVLPIHQMVKRETGWHERRGRSRRQRQTLVFDAAAEPTAAPLRCCCRHWCVPAPFRRRVRMAAPITEIMKIARAGARPRRRPR